MENYQKITDLNQKYPPFTFGSWSHCAYCGELSQCRDHVIPYCSLSSADRRIKNAFLMGPQALACSSCNSILGTKSFNTFMLRSKHVADRLFHKALKIAPTWEKEELKPLDHRLKEFIINKQNQKHLFYQRSSWFLSDAYFLNLESLIYEPRIQMDHMKFNETYFDFFKDTIERINSCLSLKYNLQKCSEEYYRYG